MNIYLLLKNIWKNTRTRFDLLPLNWATALLAKTSHSIYEEIAQVMKLPSLSYVSRKPKEMVGAQNGLKGYGVNLCTVKIISDNIIGSNKLVVNKVLVHLILMIFLSKEVLIEI